MLKLLKRVCLTLGGLLLAGLIGIAFLGYAPDMAAEDLRERYTNSESRFLTLRDGRFAGAEIHLRDQGMRGAETVLVLLHGSNASLHTWEPWVARLGRVARILTLDLPGHGLTGPLPGDPYSHADMAALTLDVMTEMGITSFVLGGNSMGGGVALSAALAAPARIQALILVDSSGIPAPAQQQTPTKRPLAFSLATNPLLAGVANIITPKSLAREGLQASFTDRSMVTDAMVTRYWHLARYPGARAAMFARFRGYLERGPLDIPVEAVKQPTLILWGEDDSLIPVEAGTSLQQRVPNASLIIYPGVGHIPMEEIPDQSADDVRRFLQQLPAKAGDQFNMAGPQELPNRQ